MGVTLGFFGRLASAFWSFLTLSQKPRLTRAYGSGEGVPSAHHRLGYHFTSFGGKIPDSPEPTARVKVLLRSTWLRGHLFDPSGQKGRLSRAFGSALGCLWHPRVGYHFFGGVLFGIFPRVGAHFFGVKSGTPLWGATHPRVGPYFFGVFAFLGKKGSMEGGVLPPFIGLFLEFQTGWDFLGVFGI